MNAIKVWAMSLTGRQRIVGLLAVLLLSIMSFVLIQPGADSQGDKARRAEESGVCDPLYYGAIRTAQSLGSTRRNAWFQYQSLTIATGIGWRKGMADCENPFEEGE